MNVESINLLLGAGFVLVLFLHACLVLCETSMYGEDPLWCVGR